MFFIGSGNGSPLFEGLLMNIMSFAHKFAKLSRARFATYRAALSEGLKRAHKIAKREVRRAGIIAKIEKIQDRYQSALNWGRITLAKANQVMNKLESKRVSPSKETLASVNLRFFDFAMPQHVVNRAKKLGLI